MTKVININKEKNMSIPKYKKDDIIKALNVVFNQMPVTAITRSWLYGQIHVLSLNSEIGEACLCLYEEWNNVINIIDKEEEDMNPEPRTENLETELSEVNREILSWLQIRNNALKMLNKAEHELSILRGIRNDIEL